MGVRSCLFQAVGLDLAFLLASVALGWPEEKWFVCNTCHGAGFARAEAALHSGVPLGLWLQLHICGCLLPRVFLEHKHPGNVGPADRTGSGLPLTGCLLPLALPTHSKGSVRGVWVKAEQGVPKGQLASH